MRNIEKFKTKFYHDVGVCHEFVLIADDVWKKDEEFINFAVRIVRLVALEVGVPVQYIGYGKWGARLTWDDEDENTLAEWVHLIENHPIYLKFKEVCRIGTYVEPKDEEQANIYTYLNMLPILKNSMTKKDAKAYAKEYLSKESYKKFLRGIDS